jgi:hypothetical protein
MVYEPDAKDPLDMHYKLVWRVVKSLDCNLLVVTSQNIILCQEKRLQLYNFKGKKLREWVLDAVIRYIRVVGGPTGREVTTSCSTPFPFSTNKTNGTTKHKQTQSTSKQPHLSHTHTHTHTHTL